MVHLYTLALFWCISTIAAAPPELLPYNPVADQSAVIIAGNARFTVLTPRLVRVEYSSSGKFEDHATLAIVNRLLPVPDFSHSVSNNILTITTSYLSVSYRLSSPFSSSTLTISSVKSTFNAWSYGQPNYGNLLGTIRSLDELDVISLNCTENSNVKVHEESLHCEWGLVSRAGWSVVDDSANYVLDSETGWWGGKNGDDIDLYFFGHGHDYKGALADFILVGGKSRWFLDMP
jgi:hypothetical protein